MVFSETAATSQGMSTQGHADSHKFCWKSTLAGVVVGFMAYLFMSALGAGIFGAVAENMINKEKDGAGLLASGAGVWMGISAVASLFLGGYFAMRVSRFSAVKIGAAHGFAVASLFFLMLAWGGASLIGGATAGAFKAATLAAEGAGNLVSNSAFQDAANRAIGNSTLKSSPKEVGEGLIVRLAQGNIDGAKNYLAYQTGSTPADVDAKVAQMRTDFEGAAKEAGEATARAVSIAGWSLFVMFLIGITGGAFGGYFGARSNISRPLEQNAYGHDNSATKPAFRATTLANQRGSAGPYILAWLLGVPGTVLIMIFMLRAIF